MQRAEELTAVLGEEPSYLKNAGLISATSATLGLVAFIKGRKLFTRREMLGIFLGLTAAGAGLGAAITPSSQKKYDARQQELDQLVQQLYQH